MPSNGDCPFEELDIPLFLKRPRDPEVEARIEASRVKVSNRGVIKRKTTS